MDLVGAIAWRLVQPVSPALHARIMWARARREGDPAVPLVERLAGPGDVAVDIGANFGMFTERLARLVGPTGHVHAVEPLPGHAAALRRLARRPNVTFHALAVSAAPGRAELHVPRGSGMDALATLEPSDDPDLETVAVAVATLDDVLAGEERPVAFVKCDVEGHEHDVLTGALGRLERDQPALLVEIEQRHRERDLAETFALLGELGYAGYALREHDLLPLERFDVERDQVAPLAAADPAAPLPPRTYLKDFLFVSPRRPLPAGVAVAA